MEDTIVHFVEPLIPLFWISGEVFPGFQSQGGFPCLRASSPVHSRFLRFTSGATPADLLSTSIVAKPFDPCTCVQAFVGLESSTASQYVTRQTFSRLSYTLFQKLSKFYSFNQNNHGHPSHVFVCPQGGGGWLPSRHHSSHDQHLWGGGWFPSMHHMSHTSHMNGERGSS